MKQAEELPKGVVGGAGGSNLCWCADLAKEAWGDLADDDNRGMAAFAYLWRRFGPPIRGTDPHKRLVCYMLTTAEPDVWLDINLSASSMAYNVMYAIDRRIESAVINEWRERYELWKSSRVGGRPLEHDPHEWRTGHPEMVRMNQALLDAMKELLRPVYIRDIAINLFGRCDSKMKPAEESEFAGLGVPIEAMRELAKD